MSPSQLRKTAYHEAGLAVAAMHLERRIRKVTIVEGEDYLGAVLYERWRNFHPHIDLTPNTRDRLEKGSCLRWPG